MLRRAEHSPSTMLRMVPLPIAFSDREDWGWQGGGLGLIAPAVDRPPHAIRGNPHIAERCQSGRLGRSRKPLCPQGYRGFESHPLRHLSELKKLVFPPVRGYRGRCLRAEREDGRWM